MWPHFRLKGTELVPRDPHSQKGSFCGCPTKQKQRVTRRTKADHKVGFLRTDIALPRLRTRSFFRNDCLLEEGIFLTDPFFLKMLIFREPFGQWIEIAGVTKSFQLKRFFF